METNKFFAFVNLVFAICLLIADLFMQADSLLLCAIITLCLTFFFGQLELLERTNGTPDKTQTPPQRNLHGEPIAKGVRELPTTKGTLQSVCEIEDLARSYLNKEHTTGMFLVVTRLNNLRRTLEMQVRTNERNTPKK